VRAYVAERLPVCEGPVVITGRQIRAAKGMLGLTTRELAALCRVSLSSVVKAERNHGVPHMYTSTLMRIQTALEGAGIEFGTDGYSVRLKRHPS
jgi:hypothetical protein